MSIHRPNPSIQIDHPPGRLELPRRPQARPAHRLAHEVLVPAGGREPLLVRRSITEGGEAVLVGGERVGQGVVEGHARLAAHQHLWVDGREWSGWVSTATIGPNIQAGEVSDAGNGRRPPDTRQLASCTCLMQNSSCPRARSAATVASSRPASCCHVDGWMDGWVQWCW